MCVLQVLVLQDEYLRRFNSAMRTTEQTLVHLRHNYTCWRTFPFSPVENNGVYGTSITPHSLSALALRGELYS